MASKSSAVEDRVCPNHPGRDAVTRCLACMKPICGECIVSVKGEDFCSKDCANNHFVSKEGVQQLDAKLAAQRRRALIRKILVVMVLLALAGGLWYSWNRVLTQKQRTQLLERVGLDK